MPFAVKTEFETVEDAIAYLKGDVSKTIKQLESSVSSLEEEKTKILAKRDEALNEAKTVKAKYKKFADYADKEDFDPVALEKESADLKAKLSEFEKSTSEVETRYRQLYDEDKKKFEERLAAIEKEREEEKHRTEQERKDAEAARLKSDAISEFSRSTHGIRNPEQFWRLFGEGMVERGDDGKLYVNHKSVSEYVETIKSNEDNLHHFKPSGASGSGTSPNSSSGGSGGYKGKNPFSKDSLNLTEQGRLFKENKELYNKLKAEANR